uniref:Uncharacterized protein n=1 Tax=Arundo donax TaxID=35708 RepID=A0A0A9ENJ1_ARUDO
MVCCPNGSYYFLAANALREKLIYPFGM